MNRIFRLVATLTIAVVALIFSNEAAAQMERGSKAFGPRAGFVSRNTSVLAGLTFEYSFSRHVRVAPEVDIYFRNKDLDALGVNLNVHFPIPFGKERWAFYPLAGVTFTSWSLHGIPQDEGKDVNNHINGLGITAGAGIEYYCTGSLKLNFESRFNAMRHYPSAFVNVGISYVF